MKSIFNSMNFKKLVLLPLIVLAFMVSCQTEETDITNPPQEEIIEANSQTATLMSRTALNDGSVDNIIDYANCLEVVLPVTVTANGVTITIESYTDYDVLEDLLDAFTDDEDNVVIAFPISVILNDYTEIVINSQVELEAKIALCNNENEEDDDIECVDFQYPILFSIYNTDFQVVETVTIPDDEALYHFLQTLNGPVLASLNFPVTLVLASGETVVVHNNQELDLVITAAEDDCDEDDDYDWNDDDDCSEQDMVLALKECVWNTVSYNGDDHLIAFDLEFSTGNALLITDTTNNTTYSGYWNVSTTAAGGLLLELANINGPNIQALNGFWDVIDCDLHRFKFINDNNTYFIMEQDCTTSVGCEVNAVEMNLKDCKWNITSYDNDSSFDIFNIDFQVNGGAVIFTPNGSEEYSANWSMSLDGEIYMELSNISGGNVQVIQGNYILVECAPTQLIFHDASNTAIELILDKDCN